MPYAPDIPLDTRQNNPPTTGDWLWRMLMLMGLVLLVLMNLRLAERVDEIGMDVLSIGTEQRIK